MTLYEKLGNGETVDIGEGENTIGVRLAPNDGIFIGVEGEIIFLSRANSRTLAKLLGDREIELANYHNDHEG